MAVGGGRQIDELGLAPGRGVATAAWIESWSDRGGGFHSQAAVSDLGGRPRALPVAGQLASGLTVAGDARGDQVIAWRSCTATPSCTVRAVVRTAGGRFGQPVSVGAVDASQDPVAAISARGEVLVGWIIGGQVAATTRTRGASGFTAARIVSSTNDASDLALAFGPGSEALAAWTEGTSAPQLTGAVYRSP